MMRGMGVRLGRGRSTEGGVKLTKGKRERFIPLATCIAYIPIFVYSYVRLLTLIFV